jgi:U3 small nucleolar RNA-associated protein 10
MCGSATLKKVEGGKKRQRLETFEIQDGEPVRFLKPLLHCFESALQADANDGGKWVRSDNNQRYHLLLSPLSRLLELRISSKISFVSQSKRAIASESAFQQLVHGSEDEPGSVIGCLTALAAAAGNEELWKPLNHAVLEACGNENRVEVRKGGISCLLSLINALGEEYMVLLPECLPVLSELLEDSDEEIAGLAQKCVSIGEELLGESLQESLR